MSDLNVTTISNSNIAKTDKLLAFNNNDSKAATIQDVVQLVPGKMAVATCSTAGNVAAKAVTCADWNNTPGMSILIEFANENSANNISLSINSGTAIPVYYMNTATEQVSGAAIPAGAVVFTLNAAGNKFYAHVTKIKTLSTVTVSDANLAIPEENKDIVYFIAYNGSNLPSNEASGNIEVSRASSYLIQRFYNYKNAAWMRKAQKESNQWVFGEWERIIIDGVSSEYNNLKAVSITADNTNQYIKMNIPRNTSMCLFELITRDNVGGVTSFVLAINRLDISNQSNLGVSLTQTAGRKGAASNSKLQEFKFSDSVIIFKLIYNFQIVIIKPLVAGEKINLLLDDFSTDYANIPRQGVINWL